MNNVRRNQLDEILTKIQMISEELESVMTNEEDYRDNIPENFQGTERYERAESACYSLQEANEELSSAIESIEVALE